MKDTPKQLVNGQWIDAVEVPYFPSLIEKVKHFLGYHLPVVIFNNWYKCLICDRVGYQTYYDKYDTQDGDSAFDVKGEVSWSDATQHRFEMIQNKKWKL